jgi:hypothetical protein
MRAKWLLSILIICSLLLVASNLRNSVSYSLIWHVLGGGGGKVSSGVYILEGALGQPMSGEVDEDSTVLCSGYWCGSEEVYGYYRQFLPMINR